MSALGQKRTFAVQNGMSALPRIADMWARRPAYGLPTEATSTMVEPKRELKCKPINKKYSRLSRRSR
jgi:hypothetical protein